MSLLTLVQDAADLCGIPRPSNVAGATDTQVRRLFALAKIEGKALMQRHLWSELVTEATHTTVASEDQGLIETIAPGFKWWVNGTVWNRSLNDYVGGPLSPQEWQEQKSGNVTGPYPEFRIWNKHLYMLPAPAAGDTLKFEYGSRFWCQSSGGTGQETWVADSDVGVLSEHLMTLGLRWRFQQMQGLDYAESFRAYEIEVANAIGRDGARRPINLNEGDCRPRGLRIPDGNWNL